LAAAFNVLITDWDALEEELRRFDEMGVEVIVVEKPGQQKQRSCN
jgi:hypothetical protein